jgi:hypothetical protein
METPSAIWGVLDAAMLVAGARCWGMAVVKGYMGELSESTKFLVQKRIWARSHVG